MRFLTNKEANSVTGGFYDINGNNFASGPEFNNENFIAFCIYAVTVSCMLTVAYLVMEACRFGKLNR